MTQSMTQTPTLWTLAQFKLLRELVDLVGIEPTTSSMPWKRAPSCATGPLVEGTTSHPLRTASIILADLAEIVNARQETAGRFESGREKVEPRRTRSYTKETLPSAL